MNYKPRSPAYLSSPFDFQKILRIIFSILLILFIGLAIIPWQQTIYGDGSVTAYSPGERQQTISAPIGGLIDRWYVVEGSTIKKGDKIVKLKDQDPLLLQRLTAEKNAITTTLNANKQALRLAQINVERQKILFEKGINAQRQYELAKLDYAKYLGEIARTEVALLNIRTRIARQKSQMVLSPHDGTIVRRLTTSHSMLIKQGEVLAELVPNTDSRVIEMMVHGNDMPLIHVNDKVVIQFEGWPAIQFSGWPFLAVNTFLGKISVINPVADSNGQFRVFVSPVDATTWPGPNYLRQGVRTHNWVQLNMVPLWWEMWRQFNGFPPQPSQPPKSY